MSNELNSRLLAYESSIDSSQYDYFRENYRRPVMKHVRCIRTGLLHREWVSGAPIIEEMTVEEHFRNIGIEKSFLGCDATTFNKLSFEVINPWGFVGYQFGEELLMTLGYYKPKMIVKAGTTQSLPQHYSYIQGTEHWAKGVKRKVHQGLYGELSVTHVNEWKGVFTGKDGARDFETLKSPCVQEAILKSSQLFNLRVLVNHFGLGELRSLIRQSSLLSWSGILASAHLCGAEGVKKYLVHRQLAVDELGTSLEQYLSKFHELDCDISSLISEL
ncbi:TPA: hypothetical protein ACGF9M_001734 [Vibrio cholerae]